MVSILESPCLGKLPYEHAAPQITTARQEKSKSSGSSPSFKPAAVSDDAIGMFFWVQPQSLCSRSSRVRRARIAVGLSSSAKVKVDETS